MIGGRTRGACEDDDSPRTDERPTDDSRRSAPPTADSEAQQLNKAW